MSSAFARVTGPRRRFRAQTARLAVGAVLGALLGAVVGGAAFLALGADSTATSMVRLAPPAELAALASGAQRTTPDSDTYVTQYVTGEVAYLSGVGFARDVAAELGQSDPAQLDVLSEMGSSVVILSASAATDSDAVTLVQTALDVYSAELAERSELQSRLVLDTLDQWEAAAVEGADFVRVQQVRALRQSIELQVSAPVSITVLAPPAVEQGTSSRPLIGAVLGALVGATAVPMLLRARRRRSGLVTSAAGVADAVDGVMVPHVDLSQPEEQPTSAISLARTLFAQRHSTGPAPTIVVIGAGGQSGTSVVAALLAAAAAEQGPVVTTKLSDEAPQTAPDAVTEVIDGGALADSPSIGAAIQRATDLIVVCRLDVDTVEQVQTVRSATASAAAPLIGVFTYRASRRTEASR